MHDVALHLESSAAGPARFLFSGQRFFGSSYQQNPDVGSANEVHHCSSAISAVQGSLMAPEGSLMSVKL